MQSPETHAWRGFAGGWPGQVSTRSEAVKRQLKDMSLSDIGPHTLDGNNMALTRVLLLPATPHSAWSLAVVMRGTAARNVRVPVEAGFDSTLPAPLLFRPSQCCAW